MNGNVTMIYYYMFSVCTCNNMYMYYYTVLIQLESFGQRALYLRSSFNSRFLHKDYSKMIN